MPVTISGDTKRYRLFDKTRLSRPGFVEIRLKLIRPQVYLDIALEVETANHGTKTYSMTLRPGATRTRIIRIRKDTRALFIRQLREPISYELEVCDLIKFPLPITLWIIQQRLAHYKERLPGNFRKIWRAYNQTFRTSLGIKNYQSWIRRKEQKPALQGFVDHPGLHIVLFSNPDLGKPSKDNRPPGEIPAQVFDLRENSDNEISRLGETIRKSEQEGVEAYFLFIREGEAFSPGAMPLLADAIKNNPGALIYSDEDSLIGNSRALPELKPDWNPEYFFDSNYTGRAVFFPAWALEKIDLGNLTPTHEQIGNLFANALLKKPETAVVHIPHICLHKLPEKNRERFSSIAVQPAITQKNASLVDILIPTRDRVEILRPCIESIIKRSTYKNYQITVIDNQSSDPKTLEYFRSLEQYKNVRILQYNRPFNYSAINNFAANQSQADTLVLLNNDIEVISPDWIESLLAHSDKPEIGCVGAKLYYPNGWIQHAGVILGIGDVAGHSHRFYPGESSGYMNRLVSTQRISAVTAACLAIRKSLWDEVGGLDEENLSVAYNDVDFCLRVSSLGYHNIWTPKAELIHHESVSRGHDDRGEKKRRYEREVAYMHKKWKVQLKQDPYYHPCLSHTKEDFSLQ